MRTCIDCKASKALDCYEQTAPTAWRQVCKPCRTIKRKAASAAAHKSRKGEADPNTPKPEACASCGKKSPEVEFTWRLDSVKGAYKSECITCYNKKNYSEVSRAKIRKVDEPAFLARNAKSHLEWAHKNPDKVKEQQVSGM